MPNDLHIQAVTHNQFQVVRKRPSNAVPDKPDKQKIKLPTAADIEDLRAYLRGLSNQELREFGTAARRNCEQTEPGDRAAVAFGIDLEEAQAEFRRRHAKKPKAGQ